LRPQLFIDFSDASPVLDWSRAEIGKFYRPGKKPVTMRLDSDIIAWLKADGCGYQTKANWPLGRNASLHQKRSQYHSATWQGQPTENKDLRHSRS
jgi:uncharacterized protein (DUF4415 family)